MLLQLSLIALLIHSANSFDAVFDLLALKDNGVTIIIPDDAQIDLDSAYLAINTIEDTSRLIVTGTFYGDALIYPVTGWLLPEESLLTSQLFGNNGSFDADTAIGVYLFISIVFPCYILLIT